ncbi:MAG TPA: hypothetical protein VHN37_01300 [Actinomycetota bacterium]|nr:hypothetical protein [Actinomycetota bacterium]
MRRGWMIAAALASALLLGACGSGDGGTPPAGAGAGAGEAASAGKGAELDRDEFRRDMRGLWEDHIAWTRLFIVSAVDDLGDVDVTAARLLRNQKEIGDAIKPFFGDAAGDRLTELLDEHILVAADLLTAAKKGDDDAVARASDAWYRNGNAIADFLAGAGVGEKSGLRSMMKGHLDTTLDEATARLSGDYEAEIAAYDEVRNHIHHMSDALADGVIAAFPDRFAPEGDDPDAASIRRDMRGLWEDHIAWTRLFIVSAVDGLADVDVTAARLLRNQTEIGDAIKPFFGDAAGTRLTKLLNEHILVAADLVTAAKKGDDKAVAAVSKAWYRNGNAIADFLAGAGVGEKSDLRSMMKGHLDTTLDEATARLSGDYEAEIVAYDEVRSHIHHMSDALAEGIISANASAAAAGDSYDY